MLPLSTYAANALATSHGMSVRATAYAATLGTVSDIPVTSGTVTVDSASQTRRVGTIGIGLGALWPGDPFAALSPLGSELGIDYGIVLASGDIEWIPVLRGPIASVTRSVPTATASEAITVTVSDRSAKVAEARFDQPTQSVVSATTVAEIRRLINEVLPTVTVTDLTGSSKVAPQLDMERERWADGIEKLADSMGAECFADTFGNFVIRNQPLITDPPAWTLSTGDGGILISENEEYSRDLVYNRVVASGQRVDGTPPVWAAVSDTDPLSPTYISGPFGIKTRFYSSPLLTTAPQCTTAAASLLARVTGQHLKVSLTAIVNPALDAGDVILIRDGRRSVAHIIDSVTIPLTPGGTQQIETRSLILPEEF
jgi:hypothetical protein